MSRTLAEIVKEINDWQRQVFTQATAKSAATHLLREARELLNDPLSEDEQADVFILLCAVSYLTGSDLESAVDKKMAVNRMREWGKPDAEGVVEHVKHDPLSQSGWITVYDQHGNVIGGAHIHSIKN